MSHSTGKWYFNVKSIVSGCRSIRVKPIGPHVNRQAQGRTIATTAGIHDDAMDRQNARLIVASPDLLRMTRILASYECAYTDCSKKASNPDDMCGPCEARFIIKNAKLRA